LIRYDSFTGNYTKQLRNPLECTHMNLCSYLGPTWSDVITHSLAVTNVTALKELILPVIHTQRTT